MGNIIKLGLILMIFCIVSAGSLAHINSLTSPIIKENALRKEKEAKQALFMDKVIDLTIFPNGVYSYNGKNGSIEFKWNNNTVSSVAYKGKNFKVSESEFKTDIKKILEIDQKIDLDKIPQKYQTFLKGIIAAFTSKVEIESVKVVKNIFGKNLEISDDLTVKIGGSVVKFIKSQENLVRVEKVDDDYIQSIVKEGKVLFNDGSGYDINEIEDYKIFEYDIVKIGSRKLGYVLKVAPQGYSSKLKTLIGLNERNRIVGLTVVSQQETPGLGAKCQESWFMEQFKNKGVEELYLKSKNKNGKIDSITAATITSQAVTGGVRQGVEDFLGLRK